MHQPSRRPRQTAPEHLLSRAANMDSVVQFEIDCRHDIQLRNGLGKSSLLILDGVPVPAALGAGVAPELDNDPRQAGQVHVAPRGGDKRLHVRGVRGDGVIDVGIALALVPEQAGDRLTEFRMAAQHRAVQRRTALVALGGRPLRHRGAAVGAGDQPLRHARPRPHFQAERQAGRDAFDHAAAEFLEVGAGRPVGTVTVAVMDHVDGFLKKMKFFAGDSPFVPHVKRAHQRVRARGVFHVADAFHVGLPGQEPDIADQHFLDRPCLGDPSTGHDPQLDAVRATGRQLVEPRGEPSLAGGADAVPALAADRLAVAQQALFDYAVSPARATDPCTRAIAAVPLQDLAFDQSFENVHRLPDPLRAWLIVFIGVARGHRQSASWPWLKSILNRRAEATGCARQRGAGCPEPVFTNNGRW